MDSQMTSTTLSTANQTAIPARVRHSLDLKAGDKLLWRVNPRQKTITLKPLPRNWGDHMLGLGKEIWQGVDAVDYVRKMRKNRKF